MAEDVEKKPRWAESSLYEQGVAHFEAEEWEGAISAFSQLASEFPDDPELQQILADLRLKASLSREEDRPGRTWVQIQRLGRPALLALGVVALITVLAGVSYFIYTNWLLPARTTRDQQAHLRELHELARGYLAAGEYDRAVDLYREILTEAPDDATATAGLERAEELQELATAYDRALELTQQERWDEALEAWRAIRATDPNFRDVNRWIAFVEEQKALQSLFTEAEMRYWIQDWSGTIQLLEQVRGQNANYRRQWVESLLVSSLVNLAEQMLSDASDPSAVYSQVMELFDRAVEIRPQDESVLTERAVAEAYAKAFARFQEGGCEGALQEIQSLYNAELHGATSQQVAILYQANIHCGDERVQAGDFQGARACYEAAIELPVDDVSEARDKYASLVPMLTPTATATPRPPTPIPTRRPATATPGPPTATPLPSYQYSMKYIEYWPNCGLTFVEGTVWKADGATQTKGARVKVWTGGWEVIRVTPTDSSKGDGYYDVIFSVEGPREGNWFVAVVDGNGNPLSETVSFDTNTADCSPNGTGHQWVIIDFQANY